MWGGSVNYHEQTFKGKEMWKCFRAHSEEVNENLAFHVPAHEASKPPGSQEADVLAIKKLKL